MPPSLGADMWGPEAWLLLLLLASSTGRLAWATGTLASAPTLACTRVHTRAHTASFLWLDLSRQQCPRKSQSSCPALCPLQPQARSPCLGSLTACAKAWPRLELPLGDQIR